MNKSVESNDPIANGLVKQISSYTFLAVTHLLYDVLNELTRLSKVFQKDSLDYSVITPSVNATIATISSMKSNPGPALKEFLDHIVTSGDIAEGHTLRVSTSDPQTFERLRQSFLAEVVVSLISAMSILDPQNLPNDEDELSTYGSTQLAVLVNHFSVCLDVSECKEEWPCLKQLAALNYSSLSLQQFWALMCKHHRERFPYLIKLAHACMAVPVATATCERGFSTQNRIKTKRLKTKRLDVLMRIVEEGPSVDKFDYNRPAKIWCEMKERRKK